MSELPKKIVSIKGIRLVYLGGLVLYEYTLNEGQADEVSISFKMPKSSKTHISFDIIDNTRDFVNGFKVVQTADKKFAYIRESDGSLLSYRYDIASDFNKYGYAMVGKDASVSWIDKEFRYFNAKEEKFLNEEQNDSDIFNGYLSIADFSKGVNPLSRVCHFGNNNLVSYFGIDGKIKEFYEFNGENIRENYPNKTFSYYTTGFNDKGYAISNNGELILLSSGYYISTKDLIRLNDEKGFLDPINNEIEKLEQEYSKFLADIEENTTEIVNYLYNSGALKGNFNISSLELMKEEIISKYGKAVYERASTNRFLAFLIISEELKVQIVNLDLFKSLHLEKDIVSFVNDKENIFSYNDLERGHTKKLHKVGANHQEKGNNNNE